MITTYQPQQTKPTWVDTNAYPFQSNFFSTPFGKLHYVDEGTGPVLLFVHGTPTWSFLYRRYIKALSKNYRCIAIDHLGFGLSDKPQNFAGTPQAHAKNLQALIDYLALDDFTLVVHDFGGPIGLSVAIAQPERVERVVLFNTWLWATKEDADAQKIDSILHSWLGNKLYLYTNFSPRYLLKKAFHDTGKLTKKTHQQYQRPFPNSSSRHGLLNIGKSLVGSSDWFAAQWKKIDRIRHKPFLVLWGDKDMFVRETHLNQWMATLTRAELHRYEAGHFVQEEAFDESLQAMRRFLA
ncbi:MAG: alpha/beta fold hydrolase [Bacteroidota bacterium]